jgi:guanylate kinase
MIVLVGASASGKTEIAKHLYKDYGYQKCITTTTRLPRIGEFDGVDYHFIDRNTFNEIKAKDLFLEVVSYQDNLYGTQKKDINLNGVVIVEPDGANSIVEKIGPEAYVVFVESSEEVRRARMIERKDQLEKILKRLESDRIIFNSNQFTRINLRIKNEKDNLDDLALKIHKNYQKYLDTNS